MSGAAHSGPSTAGSLAAGTRRIRVLVVEDSPVIQQLLSHVIGADPRLEVAGIASSGEQALRMIEKNAPDVVSLDIRLSFRWGAPRRVLAIVHRRARSRWPDGRGCVSRRALLRGGRGA